MARAARQHRRHGPSGPAARMAPGARWVPGGSSGTGNDLPRNALTGRQRAFLSGETMSNATPSPEQVDLGSIQGTGDGPAVPAPAPSRPAAPALRTLAHRAPRRRRRSRPTSSCTGSPPGIGCGACGRRPTPDHSDDRPHTRGPAADHPGRRLPHLVRSPQPNPRPEPAGRPRRLAPRPVLLPTPRTPNRGRTRPAPRPTHQPDRPVDHRRRRLRRRWCPHSPARRPSVAGARTDCRCRARPPGRTAWPRPSQGPQDHLALRRPAAWASDGPDARH